MIDRTSRRAGIASGALVLTMALAPLYVGASQAGQGDVPGSPQPESAATTPTSAAPHSSLGAPSLPYRAFLSISRSASDPVSEAATGLGNNGYLPLGAIDDDEGALAFYAAQKVFDAVETAADGVGPVYNAQSCRECHQTPMSGGSSQVSVIRSGRQVNGRFVAHPGGSLIQDRAINPAIQEVVLPGNDIVALRMSLSLLGDGFVEAVPDQALLDLAAAQPAQMRGLAVMVDVLESPGAQRVGRFGWKDQHASLVSFAADAYLNEMGITSPLLPDENSSNGRSVAAYDTVADPEEAPTADFPVGRDVQAFANFARSLTAPPRDAGALAQPAVIEGQALFAQVGCQVCHVANLVTAPPGAVLNGGAFTVTAALGGKRFHPYGDYLLHDIGTGDGVYQVGPDPTANMLRTAPLWGLRTRNRYMHDGLSFTLESAIQRHLGQATDVRDRFNRLTPEQQQRVLAFLRSL